MACWNSLLLIPIAAGKVPSLCSAMRRRMLTRSSSTGIVASMLLTV